MKGLEALLTQAELVAQNLRKVGLNASVTNHGESKDVDYENIGVLMPYAEICIPESVYGDHAYLLVLENRYEIDYDGINFEQLYYKEVGAVPPLDFAKMIRNKIEKFCEEV